MSKIGKLLLLVVTLPLLNSCSLFYVMKQGVYQLELLSGAEPIYRALRSKDLEPQQRKKLELILDVREFSRTKLHLVADRNYRDVNLSWKNSIHTVSASYPLAFTPYHWWFPIIGSVPYKGYFEETDAKQEEERLIAEGFDTQKRKIQGYSTLGYFSDPVWPSMLALSDDALIELIIHELAHATVYITNQTPFNETFANFVGKLGAKAYIDSRFGKNSSEAKKLAVYHEQLQAYRTFFYDLYVILDEIYKSSQSEEDKKAAKVHVLKNAQKTYENKFIESMFKNLDWSQVNNAYLLSFKRYNQDDAAFQDLLTAVGGDFHRFVEEVDFYAQSEDPFSSLRNRANLLSKKP